MKNRPKDRRMVRWIARVTSLLVIAIMLLFFVGEFNPADFANLATHEIIGLLCFPVGVVTGMIFAWWREGLGSLIGILSLVVFYLVELVANGDLPRGPFFFLFTLPAFLFGIAWLQIRRDGSQAF